MADIYDIQREKITKKCFDAIMKNDISLLPDRDNIKSNYYKSLVNVSNSIISNTSQLNYGIKNTISKLKNQIDKKKIKLESGWKFKLISSTSISSYKPTTELAFDFDDTTWNSVTVPHDWSIHQSFNENSLSGFDGGFLDGGDGLYRLKLTDISSEKGNRIH